MARTVYEYGVPLFAVGVPLNVAVPVSKEIPVGRDPEITE